MRINWLIGGVYMFKKSKSAYALESSITERVHFAQWPARYYGTDSEIKASQTVAQGFRIEDALIDRARQSVSKVVGAVAYSPVVSGLVKPVAKATSTLVQVATGVNFFGNKQAAPTPTEEKSFGPAKTKPLSPTSYTP